MTDAASFEVDEPILCSPYEEPAEHWVIEEGKLPERRAGRRAAGYFYRDPSVPMSGDEFTRGDWVELELVNQIRERLAEWRGAGYPGATRTTVELLEYLAQGRARNAALLPPGRGRRDNHLPDRRTARSSGGS